MQCGNAAIDILAFRWGILSRGYFPKRWPSGDAQNGGNRGIRRRARNALSPPEIPRELGCRRMMGMGGGIMANRRRAIRPPSGPKSRLGIPYFLRHFREADGPALVFLKMWMSIHS